MNFLKYNEGVGLNNGNTGNKYPKPNQEKTVSDDPPKT